MLDVTAKNHAPRETTKPEPAGRRGQRSHAIPDEYIQRRRFGHVGRIAAAQRDGVEPGERPDDAVLSEEGADNPIRLRSERVWIVDPLDGTREFSELGRKDWAVHVALWQSGELVAGAVALPAQGVTLATPDPAPPPDATEAPRIVVSRTRPPAIALQVRDHLNGTLVEMGSAGAKVAAVVQGLADVYVHAGGQYEWDSAAPVAVARAAGLHTSRIDGSPLQYNRPDPLLPDLVVCRREFADAVLAVTG